LPATLPRNRAHRLKAIRNSSEIGRIRVRGDFRELSDWFQDTNDRPRQAAIVGWWTADPAGSL